jgi:hypothetical protein
MLITLNLSCYCSDSTMRQVLQATKDNGHQAPLRLENDHDTSSDTGFCLGSTDLRCCIHGSQPQARLRVPDPDVQPGRFNLFTWRACDVAAQGRHAN